MAVLAVVVSLLATGPAAAVDSTDFTGDVTAPSVVSFTVSPAGGDVTLAAATFSVSLHITDDLSGVGSLSLGWLNLQHTADHGVALIRSAGTDLDGTWTGTFEIPRYSPAGRYALEMSVTDRVGNGHYYDWNALAARNLASGVDIVDSNPDATPPQITGVQVTPSTVDVRAGAAGITVDVTVSDPQSRVKGLVVFLHSLAGTAGGSNPPPMNLVSGTTSAGVWRGTTTLPEHTPAGRWTLEVRAFDNLDNERDLDGGGLRAAGLTDGFDVASYADTQAPRLVGVLVEPSEVNVHDADQDIRITARVTDDLTGVKHLDNIWYTVWVDTYDLVTGQDQGRGLRLVSGTLMDGVYEGIVTIPRSSATGLRRVSIATQDAVDNAAWIAGVDLVAAGGPAALLVYNVPLPPSLVDVEAGDGSAVIRWDPPADDRGSAVTGYVVRVAPDGVEVHVSADLHATVVAGLANGVRHDFTVTAVNKAGPSDPSSPLSAVPLPHAGSGGGSGRSGYWMTTADGTVYPFGDAPRLGNATSGRDPVVDLEPTPSRAGYWVLDSAGSVHTFGDAPNLGSAGPLPAGDTVTSLSATPSGRGYWMFTTRGRALAFGDAPFLGDVAFVRLNRPILDSVATPSGRGYYMVASDGGVFAFGDARFAGSTGSRRLNAPVQSLVPDTDGDGYWLVASDGGIFAFSAPFFGSMGATHLNRPITGMVGSPTGGGYLMVAEDGGIFTFGDAPFRGSLGGSPPPVPVTAVASL
jgi:fibronectin type III domain protein